MYETLYEQQSLVAVLTWGLEFSLICKYIVCFCPQPLTKHTEFLLQDCVSCVPSKQLWHNLCLFTKVNLSRAVSCLKSLQCHKRWRWVHNTHGGSTRAYDLVLFPAGCWVTWSCWSATAAWDTCLDLSIRRLNASPQTGSAISDAASDKTSDKVSNFGYTFFERLWFSACLHDLFWK